ncbi:hypothetical protein ACFLXV_00995 [Chloroflexota bacterium]
MRKLAIIVCLIGLLIGSTLAGIALADKPDAVKPLDTMDEIEQNTETIIEGVGNITDRLDDPTFGLEEIKTEVATIEDEVLHPDWGLEEIKTEVAAIEGNVTDPLFGLAAIEIEVADIQSQLADPATGLAEIKAEVAAIEENVTSVSGNVTELKAEIESIKDNVDKLMTPGLCVDFLRYYSNGDWDVDVTVTNKGIFAIWRVWVELYHDGVKIGSSKYFPVLSPGTEIDMDWKWSGTYCDTTVTVEVIGEDSWSGSVSASDERRNYCH